MSVIGKFTPFTLAIAAVLLAASSAEAKTITESCKKELASGIYTYDLSKISENYVISVVRFRESSRDSRYAYGVCTINLKYQPAD
jgi:hypothetical protein